MVCFYGLFLMICFYSLFLWSFLWPISMVCCYHGLFLWAVSMPNPTAVSSHGLFLWPTSTACFQSNLFSLLSVINIMVWSDPTAYFFYGLFPCLFTQLFLLTVSMVCFYTLFPWPISTVPIV